MSPDRNASICELARRLVRLPTQSGIDPLEPAVAVIESWLNGRGLPTERWHQGGDLVGVSCTIAGAEPGPVWVLDAPLDTAPIGDPDLWTRPPTAAAIEDGWLWGRGVADSKAAVAVFCHVAEWLADEPTLGAGGLVLLFDGDEHSGGFGGARAYFGDAERRARVGGVMIGYPGNDRVVCGGRGFLRARLRVGGVGRHSGSSQTEVVNAVSKAASLIAALEAAPLPLATDAAPPGAAGPDRFGLPPKLTVTRVRGGEAFAVVPSRCDVEVDVRLVPAFDAEAAERLIRETAAAVDLAHPLHPPTTIEIVPGWPAYRLSDASRVADALVGSASEVLGRPVPCSVAGPSNIGNYLASLGVDATAGFGVTYRNIHAADEGAEVASLGMVFAVYRRAVERLLAG